jgi:hypothetical protein
MARHRGVYSDTIRDETAASGWVITVMKVRTMAMTTNIEKRRVFKMPACRPTLSTISSTKLEMGVSSN